MENQLKIALIDKLLHQLLESEDENQKTNIFQALAESFEILIGIPCFFRISPAYIKKIFELYVSSVQTGQQPMDFDIIYQFLQKFVSHPELSPLVFQFAKILEESLNFDFEQRIKIISLFSSVPFCDGLCEHFDLSQQNLLQQLEEKQARINKLEDDIDRLKRSNQQNDQGFIFSPIPCPCPKVSLGLNFGSPTFSIAVVSNNGLTFLRDDQGKDEIPFVLYINEGNFLIPSISLDLSMTNSISGFHHLIGRMFSDSLVQDFINQIQSSSPFRFSENSEHLPLIISGDKQFSFVDLISNFFNHSIQMFKNNFGNCNYSQFVVAYPDYYTDIQKHSLIQAANLAGIQPFLVSESIAACVEYQEKFKINNGIFLVVYLYEEIRATVVQYEDQRYKILATN